jgi:HlyD family secretion protein
MDEQRPKTGSFRAKRGGSHGTPIDLPPGRKDQKTRMDRPLDPDFSRRRRRVRVAVTVASLGALGLAAAGFGALLAPTVARSQIVTGTVDRGPVAGSLSATGTVVPEVEEVLPAPADVRVTRVVRHAGTLLAPGDPILELDMGMAKIALDRVSQDLALKENAAARTRLDLEDRLSDLDSTVKVKRLQLETYRAALARNTKLYAEGLVSQEVLKQSELDEARTTVELARLEEQRLHAQKSAATTIEGIALEQATLRRERDENARTMAYAVTRADRAGVLTWVADQEGASLHRGDVLARIADLTAFRVEATVPDVHASRVLSGMPAVIRIGDDRLLGTIARVLPSVQNGLVTLQVRLDDPRSRLLRPNLRVDVDLVTAKKDSVLRLRKGAFGGASADLFVVKGDRAVRRRVTFGITGADELEVVSGLAAGEEVVLTDMSAYANLKSVRLTGR